LESTAFIILISIAAVGVGAVLFAGWLVLAALRGGMRLLGGAIGINSRPNPEIPPARVICPRKRCHAINPPEARFCRRCGIELPPGGKRAAPAATPVSKAAVW
jgi:hypothetical protein